MEKRKSQKWSMLEGTPGIALFLFALPLILGNLFQQFYNMVDSMIVGQFVGENALAAVGASYALTNVFVMIAIGGGMGASVITSQYLGAGDTEKMKTGLYGSSDLPGGWKPAGNFRLPDEPADPAVAAYTG